MVLLVAKAILSFLCASLYLCSTNFEKTNLPSNVSVSAILAFGDSFVDQGNNNYIDTIGKANFLPYGKDFMGGIPTGRFSNGKTIADFFAEAFGVKEYLPASLDPSLQIQDLRTGVSFASGGSGFDTLTTTTSSAIPPPDQLENLKQYIGKLTTSLGEEAANDIIAESVFLVVISTNDLLISLPVRRLEYGLPTYANMLANLATNFAQELYTLGARRIAFFSAPPVGCFPAVRTIFGGLLRRCSDDINEAAQLYNSMLQEQLQLLESNLTDSRIAFVDFYNPIINLINNPQQYGLRVTDRGCCGTGIIEVVFLCNILSPTCNNDSQFLFWDSIHLSEIGASIFVDQILPDLVLRLF